MNRNHQKTIDALLIAGLLGIALGTILGAILVFAEPIIRGLT